MADGAGWAVDATAGTVVDVLGRFCVAVVVCAVWVVVILASCEVICWIVCCTGGFVEVVDFTVATVCFGCFGIVKLMLFPLLVSL